MTIYGTYDTDGVPAPHDWELDWPGFEVQPITQCGYAFWCQLRGINEARPYLWQWIEDHYGAPSSGKLRIYSVSHWDSLLTQFIKSAVLRDVHICKD